MSTKKTIQINPEFIRLGKTKKNNAKKELTLRPVITPSSLKNKLLNRIKEHKNKEHKVNPINKKMQPKLTGTNGMASNGMASNAPNDEFYGALDYLSKLTKNKKRERIINNKTLKTNYEREEQRSNDRQQLSLEQAQISLDLPQELQDNPHQMHQDVFNINYKVADDVPYGCLKNGQKKTYREWKEINREIQLPDMVRPPTPPKKKFGEQDSEMLTRSERLEQIKTKIKKLQNKEANDKQQLLQNFKQLENKVNKNTVGDDLADLDDDLNINETKDIEEILHQKHLDEEKSIQKKYTKKTTKRNFTLGKNDKLRKVSILVKDKQTKKNIINTQKELKKTHINDVKKYLRQHGMVKVGSTCPNDILRKTFESAVLSGEVTNINKDVLLHNFLHTDMSSSNN